MNSYSRGMTLIELIVSMALSLTLLLGVYQVVDLNQRAQAFIDSENQREEQAQLALTLLADSIRMADYWGGVDYQYIKQHGVNLSGYPGECDLSWVLNPKQSVFGMEGSSQANTVTGLPHNCLKKRDYLAESDLLKLQYADSKSSINKAELDNKQYQKYVFIRLCPQLNAAIFQGKASESIIDQYAFSDCYINHPIRSDLFFLKPCSASKNSCASETSVLSRLSLKGGRYQQETLLENIEQLQFEYGIDRNQDKQIEALVTANNVTDWSDVLMVRLFILVRSHIPDYSQDLLARVYKMHSEDVDGGFDFVVPESSRFFTRKLYQRDVVIRNRTF